MLKHIVLFKLKESADGASKEQNAKKMVEILNALRTSIPVVKHLEAGTNAIPSDASYDVAIYSEFANEQDLKTYISHPEHQKVVEFVKKVVESRVAVDYNI